MNLRTIGMAYALANQGLKYFRDQNDKRERDIYQSLIDTLKDGDLSDLTDKFDRDQLRSSTAPPAPKPAKSPARPTSASTAAAPPSTPTLPCAPPNSPSLKTTPRRRRTKAAACSAPSAL